jgi:hypothetical protein
VLIRPRHAADLVPCADLVREVIGHVALDPRGLPQSAEVATSVLGLPAAATAEAAARGLHLVLDAPVTRGRRADPPVAARALGADCVE